MGISRIQRVETELQRMTRNIIDENRFASTGVTTDALAGYLRLARVNVSRDLNQLVREKKAVKIKLRPVLYFSVVVIEQELSEMITNFEVKNFDELFNSKSTTAKNNDALFPLVGASGSLAPMVENAKSAMVYPPHGLHTLLTGETGVGKSLFAEAMYNFGKKFGTLTKDAPLVVFNCADYANNPQLLMSQLFGYTKGAFTGADNDSPGLIDKAENGILFLDEIHRLPPEGQEMLFQLIDKGVYRKMGAATKPRKANVLIIGATTESEKNFLPTLMRRIPVVINLPSIAERPLTERFQLIEHFFNLESTRIQKQILVSREIVKNLLTYKCTGNIGQLRSDIQVICAKGLYKSIQAQKDNIEIKLTDLPPLIY
ncbi:MAG: sigma 54-interacting transcriptional regulator, partial [Lacticaseibacillus paracasei]